MKKITFIGALIGMTMMTAPAFAMDNTYVSIGGGVSFAKDQEIRPNYGENWKQPINAAAPHNIAIGMKEGETRAEFEVGHQQFNPKNDSGNNSRVYSLLANGYYDFLENGITPFVTGGIGVGFFNSDNECVDNKTAFAYQVGAGVAVPVSDSVTIDAKYRHFGTTQISQNDYKFTPSSDAILLGVRVGI